MSQNCELINECLGVYIADSYLEYYRHEVLADYIDRVQTNDSGYGVSYRLEAETIESTYLRVYSVLAAVPSFVVTAK